MDKANIALLSYGLTVVLLCICAVLVLYVTLINAVHDKAPVYYFILMFITLSLGFLCYITRSYIPVWVSIASTNFLLLLSMYSLRHAFKWRRGIRHHLYLDFMAMGNILFIVLVNTFLFYILIDSLLYRIIVLQVNICFVLLLSRRDVAINSAEITAGERQTRAGLILSTLLVLSILVVIPFIDDPWYHATYVLMIMSLFIVILLGITLNLVLSDIIDIHYKNSITDILTGLFNRRYFMSQFLLAINQSRRSHEPISILICDIDLFKKVNDKYGHDAGDLALQAFSKMLKSSVRDVDTLARYGGEEFIILMPQTPLEQAKQIAERIRSNTEKLTIVSNQHKFSFTVSVGLSICDGEFNIENSIKVADEALYEAKERGRNQVFCH